MQISMRCLIVDHQDSFTYNIVAIVRNLIGNSNVQISDHRDSLSPGQLASFTHFILSPGPGAPDEVGPLTRAVLEISVQSEIPLLGICLGLQVIAYRFLGSDSVIRAPSGPKHGVVDLIEPEIGNFLFTHMPQPFKAVRYHSLVADDRKFSEISDLRITAVSRSDAQVMALEHKKFPIYAVQFHPESILSEHGNFILRNFLRLPPPSPDASLPPLSIPREDRSSQPVDTEIARKIFFSLVYEEKFPCVWLQNERRVVMAGGRLGTGRPTAINDRKFLLAGFRSYEGKDCFLDFENFIIFEDGLWKLHSQKSSSDLEISSISTASSPESARPGKFPALDFNLVDSGDVYRKKVREILEGPLLSGNSYEICLTTEMAAKISCDGEALALQAWLAHLEGRPLPEYSGVFLNYPDGHLVSFSPECFLSADGKSEFMHMRPIKGTRARGGGKSDAEIVRELKTSEKDIRENLMIVDLVRNDFNKISDSSVNALFEVEILEHTVQMFSEISAKKPPEISDAVDALFPAGSMTGAPKVRSMEILRSLENRPRGVYSGICGFFLGERADLGVVIRSVHVHKNRLSLSAGGAIVHGSDADAEWREVLTKFNKPLSVLQQISDRISIHNLRKEPVRLQIANTEFVESLLVRKISDSLAQIFFLPSHFARLKNSRGPFDEFNDFKLAVEKFLRSSFGEGIFFEYVDEALIERSDSEDFKLRILWSEISSVNFRLEQLRSMSASSAVKLASEAVFSLDALLNRKYVVSSPESAILRFNEHGEVTEGSWFNFALFRGGLWVTPLAKCGLLQGIYRKFLLERGSVVEGVVKVETLKDGEQVMCFNSVRGVWMANFRS